MAISRSYGAQLAGDVADDGRRMDDSSWWGIVAEPKGWLVAIRERLAEAKGIPPPLAAPCVLRRS
ncbi:hypothetical protein M1N91_02805 [Dehalococcoidia bacterium]|nr:hypothetical protein [Dehalococcoidia bacterium]MCL0073130.1 hypothetical protein [Dehalococcoidia bacterium]